MTEGRFIVLEGVDGCGSTTQTRRLVEALRARGRAAEPTFEPSNGPVGSFLRSVLERRLMVPGHAEPWSGRWSTLALLFSADRLDHLDSMVLPALRGGTTVVSDRYDLSSLAYQSVTASGDGERVLPWIRELNRHARRPDLTLVLDVPFEEAAARRRRRGGKEELFDAQGIQRKLVLAYERAEGLVVGDRLIHVSGLGAMEDVTSRLLAAVLSAFPEL
jgi:dTMP kinase